MSILDRFRNRNVHVPTLEVNGREVEVSPEPALEVNGREVEVSPEPVVADGQGQELLAPESSPSRRFGLPGKTWATTH